MKSEYPTFEKGELKEYYSKMPKSEKEILDGFLIYVSANASTRRVEENLRSITQFRMLIEKDFDSVTLQDLREFLALLNKCDKAIASKNEVKADVKRFLRYRFKDWSNRFDDLRDIKLARAFNEKKINSQTILKKSDIEAIMRAEPRLFWKTFFITLYESGLRPNECRNLKWENLEFNVDGEISKIHIFATKTHHARSVFVKNATKYLKQLKLNQDDKNLYVFPSRTDKPLTRGGVSNWFNRISKRVLGRKVYPYMLRHSRGTEIYNNANIPDSVALRLMGHSKSMSQVYTHLDDSKIKDALKKSVYNLDEFETQKENELEDKIEVLSKELDEFKKNSEQKGEAIKQMLIQLVELMKMEFNIKRIDAKKISSAIEVFQ